jgi:hypothetical protein
MTIALQTLSLVEKAELVQVCFTLHLRNQWSKWVYDGCKVYMDSYMGVKWIMFHGQLDYLKKLSLGCRPKLKIGRSWHSEISQSFIYYILLAVTKPHEWKIIEIAFGWGPSHIMTSHYTWGSVTTLHDFGSVLGQPWALFLGFSLFHDHGSWLVCEVALTTRKRGPRTHFSFDTSAH